MNKAYACGTALQ